MNYSFVTNERRRLCNIKIANRRCLIIMNRDQRKGFYHTDCLAQ